MSAQGTPMHMGQFAGMPRRMLRRKRTLSSVLFKPKLCLCQSFACMEDYLFFLHCTVLCLWIQDSHSIKFLTFSYQCVCTGSISAAENMQRLRSATLVFTSRTDEKRVQLPAERSRRLRIDPWGSYCVELAICVFGTFLLYLAENYQFHGA